MRLFDSAGIQPIDVGEMTQLKAWWDNFITGALGQEQYNVSKIKDLGALVVICILVYTAAVWLLH